MKPEPVWVVKGSVPVMYIQRIIPRSWGIARDECQISDTMSNVDLIEWVMTRFPLEIDKSAQERWNARLSQLQVERNRRETLQTLVPVDPSKSFVGELRQFQKIGLDFLLKTDGRALLADEMGLGKGVQAIAYLATSRDVFPVCIVAPLVTLKHWEREIARFLRVDDAKASIKTIRSGKAEDLRSELLRTDIYLINYDLLSKRVEDLSAIAFQTIIFDEIQAMRNTGTLRYQAGAELLNSQIIKHVLGLSGTPIHNNGGELWSVANLIRPGLLGSWEEFIAQHCSVTWNGKVHARDPQALYGLLRDEFLLRRRMIEVLSEMPPKLRIKEHIEADLRVYQQEVSKILEDLDLKLKGTKSEFEKAALKQHVMTQERQIAAMCKVEYVVKWVQACLESEQPIVVYFHHKLIREALERYLGSHKPCVIAGGQRDLERDNEIQRFQRGDSKLMLASIRAGSLGINLTASAIIIFAELDWTPAIHRQAEGRLHRIGQEKQVLSYYLIADGTLDEKVVEVLVDKTEEISALFGDVPEGENTDEAIKAFDTLRELPAFRDLPVLKKTPDIERLATVDNLKSLSATAS